MVEACPYKIPMLVLSLSISLMSVKEYQTFPASHQETGERYEMGFSFTDIRRSQPCPYLHLGFQTSRAIRNWFWYGKQPAVDFIITAQTDHRCSSWQQSAAYLSRLTLLFLLRLCIPLKPHQLVYALFPFQEHLHQCSRTSIAPYRKPYFISSHAPKPRRVNGTPCAEASFWIISHCHCYLTL